jgi:hypothetical protein
VGLSSCLFFVWSFVAGSPHGFPIVESFLLAVLTAAALRVRRMSRVDPRPDALPGQASATGFRLLAVVVIGAAVGGVIAFVAESAMNPHGSWDAWMTWNMHARAIFRGGTHWREVLMALPDWSHPDYPLLVPGSVARIWTYLSVESDRGPILVGLLFTFATVAVLYASVSILRSRTQGMLATLLLLGTKFFILHGASQYADIPLAFFFLATLALLSLTELWPQARPKLLVLAGLTAGLAAWTKNEGLLFMPVVMAGYGLVGLRARGRSLLRDARFFAIGLAPLLALVLAFKLWVAAPNDLMSDQGLAQTAARLLESERYTQVLAGFVQAFLEVGARGLVALVLLVYLLIAGFAPPGPARPGARMTVIVLVCMLAGYAAVLLVAPGPRLGTNIRSINRLLLQLWPSILLAYFLLVRTAEEASSPAWRARTPLEPA